MMKPYRTLPIILFAASLLSCTVKEDRDVCPCWLDIDLSGCGRFTDMVSLKGWSSGNGVLGENVYRADYEQLYEAEVPRGQISYCASSELKTSLQSGMSVIIPEGEQSDRLYAYRADVITLGETAFDKVRLHKQFAAVTMKFEDESSDYHIVIRSGWNGMDLTTLKPTKGAFTFTPEPNKERIWYFRLPRQGDASIQMDVTTVKTGRTETFDLGGLIARTGYDWTAEDLDDIYIGIDYATADIKVTILPWKEGTSYNEIQ